MNEKNPKSAKKVQFSAATFLQIQLDMFVNSSPHWFVLLFTFFVIGHLPAIDIACVRGSRFQVPKERKLRASAKKGGSLGEKLIYLTPDPEQSVENL